MSTSKRIDEIKQRFKSKHGGCLVPSKEAVGTLSSHEKTLCDCDTQFLLSALEIAMEGLEDYRGLSGRSCLESYPSKIASMYSSADEALSKINALSKEGEK